MFCLVAGSVGRGYEVRDDKLKKFSKPAGVAFSHNFSLK